MYYIGYFIGKLSCLVYMLYHIIANKFDSGLKDAVEETYERS